jgi:DNA-binding transcriptional ArsR family regulator
MNKSHKFDKSLQELAGFAKVISHPARLSILKYLAESRISISGEISGSLPLSRTTVSQHLSELRRAGLIDGEINGLKVSYRLNRKAMKKFSKSFKRFFSFLKDSSTEQQD